jgi:hypothetical protein
MTVTAVEVEKRKRKVLDEMLSRLDDFVRCAHMPSGLKSSFGHESGASVAHSYIVVLTLFLLTTFGESHRLSAFRLSEVTATYRSRARKPLLLAGSGAGVSLGHSLALMQGLRHSFQSTLSDIRSPETPFPRTQWPHLANWMPTSQNLWTLHTASVSMGLRYTNEQAPSL